MGSRSARNCRFTEPLRTCVTTQTKNAPVNGLKLDSPPARPVMKTSCHLVLLRPLASSAVEALAIFVVTSTPEQRSPTKEPYRARTVVVCSRGQSNNVETFHAQQLCWGIIPDQLRGTSFQGRSRSTRTSPGRPRTRSPRMFLIISAVPPSIVFARLRKNATREIEARPEPSPPEA